MRDLFPEIDVSDQQAEAIARGLYAVAAADGELHPQERAIIREFFVTGATSAADFGALERLGAIEAEPLAQILATPDARRLFLKTALLCAWADGAYSKGEAKVITVYAKACDIADDELRELTAQVKEFLLASLSHLDNNEAKVELKKELGL